MSISPQKFRLEVSHGEAGLWYVTSPDDRGLLSTGETLDEALSATAVDLKRLWQARAWPARARGGGHPYDPSEPRPIWDQDGDPPKN